MPLAPVGRHWAKEFQPGKIVTDPTDHGSHRRLVVYPDTDETARTQPVRDAAHLAAMRGNVANGDPHIFSIQ